MLYDKDIRDHTGDNRLRKHANELNAHRPSNKRSLGRLYALENVQFNAGCVGGWCSTADPLLNAYTSHITTSSNTITMSKSSSTIHLFNFEVHFKMNPAKTRPIQKFAQATARCSAEVSPVPTSDPTLSSSTHVFQASAYGKCIVADFNAVHKDKCLKEFMKLKDCYLVCHQSKQITCVVITLNCYLTLIQIASKK